MDGFSSPAEPRLLCDSYHSQTHACLAPCQRVNTMLIQRASKSRITRSHALIRDEPVPTSKCALYGTRLALTEQPLAINSTALVYLDQAITYQMLYIRIQAAVNRHYLHMLLGIYRYISTWRLPKITRTSYCLPPHTLPLQHGLC